MKQLAFIILLFTTIFLSCESDQEKAARQAKEAKIRIEWEFQEKENVRLLAEQSEKIRIESEIKLALEKEKKEIYNKYIDNSLTTGSVPYSYCYGKNRSCNSSGCSQIKVKTPSSSDVLVTIKQNGNVVRHAYIEKSSTYTFELNNGTYQPFFYYGKGWNPNKVMKSTEQYVLRGGFIEDEIFGKDDPQYLNNNILAYELILQPNGNFSTRPSNANEAF